MERCYRTASGSGRIEHSTSITRSIRFCSEFRSASARYRSRFCNRLSLTLNQRLTRIRPTQDTEDNRVALKIRINRKSVESMTRQLTDQLGELISTGAMAVGSLLPSERTLANSLGIARNV